MFSTQHGRVAHPFLLGFLGIAAVALTALAYLVFGPSATRFAGGHQVALAAYRDANPTGVPKELNSLPVAARGEYLAHAADCMVCHTAKDGVRFAGGRAFVLPFGTLYSTNITPDKETGIGSYTDAEFLNALHRGIGRTGAKLYPAMPFPSYTLMSDADALAIKAYLLTLTPMHASPPPNTLGFPFNQRALMGIWSLFFNSNRRFEPNTQRSAQWNRGAYLAEALGHCGECHTPRNFAFASNHRKKFSGDVQAGWRAYNITSNSASGVGAWSDADLVQYLSTGHAAGRDTAAGPMGEVVDESLRHLNPADITAIVAYLRTVPGIASPALPALRSAASAATAANSEPAHAGGKLIYQGACSGCHGWSGVSPGIDMAVMTGSRAVNDPTAMNVAQVILRGAGRHYEQDFENMPAFGGSYSDAEVASIANYVTGTFGAKGSSLTADEVARLRAAD